MKRNIGGNRVRHIILWMCLALFFSVGGSAQAQTNNRVHVVQSGETLYRIGKQYGVTVADLYRLNPSARQGIRVGERLVLPAGAGSGTSSDQEFYAVKKGDTLYSIARRAGTTVKELMALNSFLKSPDDIAAGMIIKLPGYSSGVSSSPEAKRVEPAAADSLNGIRLETVSGGATVYSLVKGTAWSEEDFYRYNPQVLERGLRAGESVFLPDGSIPNNLAARSVVATRPSTGSGTLDVVLALPFRLDRERRFADYYEGFLMSVLDAKQEGRDINLYVYSCDDVEMPSTKVAISNLPDVDLIIGGVSVSTIRQLSELARYKQATYVIPFSSKEVASSLSGRVYQINTPAALLYDQAAERFIQTYGSYHVLFVNPMPGEEESPFVMALKNRLRLAGSSYSECASSDFMSGEDVSRQSLGHLRMVVVPSSSSLQAARQVLSAIVIAQEDLTESSVVTAFGYPEWQTYASSLGRQMYRAEATFFTTFFIYPRDSAYQRFSADYMKWFGHGTGNTFPRYSALGYDTGSYFLRNDKGSDSAYKGVQSLLDFGGSAGGMMSRGVKSNQGVFFVRYNKDNSVSRF